MRGQREREREKGREGERERKSERERPGTDKRGVFGGVDSLSLALSDHSVLDIPTQLQHPENEGGGGGGGENCSYLQVFRSNSS